MQVYCTSSPKAWISFCKTLMIHQGKKVEGNDSKGQGARVGWNLECMLWAEGGVGLKDLHGSCRLELQLELEKAVGISDRGNSDISS
ncbi:hypothetical protein V6N13_120339 [Hibiscus sabdariffa]